MLPWLGHGVPRCSLVKHYFGVFLWGCFLMILTFKLVDWSKKQIAPHNVEGSHSSEGQNRTERLTLLWVRDISPAHCRLTAFGLQLWHWLLLPGSLWTRTSALSGPPTPSAHLAETELISFYNHMSQFLIMNDSVHQPLSYSFCFSGEPWRIHLSTWQGQGSLPSVWVISVVGNLKGVSISLLEKTLDS